MPKSDHMEFDGSIEESLGGGKYRCKVEHGLLIAQLSGKMRLHGIRVTPGDSVRISVSPYDTTNGIITFRSK